MLSSKLQQLKNLIGPVKTIGILGYGVEGRSSYSTLKELYPEADFIIMDQNENLDIAKDSHTTATIGDGYLSKIEDCDIVLKSPGIKLATTYPTVTSQSRLFTQLYGDKTIGITGTKGKSTTATLIHHILTGQYKTALVGNIGQPAFESMREEYDYYVYEYSCHQLSDMHCSPRYAVLLNLFPEHLDYYSSVAEYYDAKKNIYIHQTTTDLLLTSVEQITKGRQITLGTPIDIGTQTLTGSSTHVLVGTESVLYNNALRGEHNQLNQLYAICIAIALDIDLKIVHQQIASFTGLPHRLETVFHHQGLRYVNDSISTIPQSTIAAMKSYEDLKIVLIGGYDRGIDYSSLIDFLNNSDGITIILFSQVGQIIADAIDVPYIYKKKFDDAVTFTVNLGLTTGTILMSPAASSYDQFSSFIQRGERYSELVLTKYTSH